MTPRAGGASNRPSATLFVINWLDKKDQGLVAACNIQAFATAFAQAIGANIHANRDTITAAIMENAPKRDSEAQLLSAAAIGSPPVGRFKRTYRLTMSS